jgi:hypothetical protein
MASAGPFLMPPRQQTLRFEETFHGLSYFAIMPRLDFSAIDGDAPSVRLALRRRADVTCGT